MEEDKCRILISGQALTAGQFVELPIDVAGLTAGPYRYEGYQNGGHLWSVAGEMFISSVLEKAGLKLLPWKKWRKPEARAKQVFDGLEKNRSRKQRG